MKISPQQKFLLLRYTCSSFESTVVFTPQFITTYTSVHITRHIRIYVCICLHAVAIIVVVILLTATHYHRQKHKAESHNRTTSNVLDATSNTQALPPELSKTNKLQIPSKHESEDLEMATIHYNPQGSLSPPEDGEENFPLNLTKMVLQNPLYDEHEPEKVEETNVDSLDATATSQPISGQK